MVTREHAVFDAKLELLESMMDWVRKEVSRVKFSKANKRKIEIALEEALVNIIHYAYPNSTGTIELTCTTDPERGVEYTIIDQGAPFNPLIERPQDQSEAALEEREEGGLGIFLMCSLMDEVQYQRSASCNILTLSKKR